MSSGGAETGKKAKAFLPGAERRRGDRDVRGTVEHELRGKNNAHALSTTPAKPTRRGGPDGSTLGNHEFSRSAEAFRAS